MQTYGEATKLWRELGSAAFMLNHRYEALTMWMLVRYVTERVAPDVVAIHLDQSENGDWYVFGHVELADGTPLYLEGDDDEPLDEDEVDGLAGSLSSQAEWPFVHLGRVDLAAALKALQPLMDQWFDPPPDDLSDLTAVEQWLDSTKKEVTQ